uniref:Uncharacterized protein n=1 Tax=Anguilla anguilla TaxID=7936 RepID=A0A0E9S2Z5_ANGAN
MSFSIIYFMMTRAFLKSGHISEFSNELFKKPGAVTAHHRDVCMADAKQMH